jgi:hypothetical protein
VWWSRSIDFIGISKKRPEGFCLPFKLLEANLRDGAFILLPITSSKGIVK